MIRMITSSLFVVGMMLLFPVSCAHVPPMPADNGPKLDALLSPCVVEGVTKLREDAATNGELWDFAGAQEQALELCNYDKVLVKRLLDAEHRPPDRKWWEFWKWHP